jgi:hypothetical protein
MSSSYLNYEGEVVVESDKVQYTAEAILAEYTYVVVVVVCWNHVYAREWILYTTQRWFLTHAHSFDRSLSLLQVSNHNRGRIVHRQACRNQDTVSDGAQGTQGM